MTTQNLKENGSASIIKRLRARLCRQAFEKFKKGVQSTIQDEKDAARCEYYKQTLATRELRKMFYAWVGFQRTFKKARKYWSRLFGKMDNNQKKSAFRIWKNWKQKHVEFQLMSAEEEMQSQVAEMNQ